MENEFHLVLELSVLLLHFCLIFFSPPSPHLLYHQLSYQAPLLVDLSSLKQLHGNQVS